MFSVRLFALALGSLALTCMLAVPAVAGDESNGTQPAASRRPEIAPVLEKLSVAADAVDKVATALKTIKTCLEESQAACVDVEKARTDVADALDAAAEAQRSLLGMLDALEMLPMPGKSAPDVGPRQPSGPAAQQPAEEPQQDEPPPPPAPDEPEPEASPGAAALPALGPADLPAPPSPEPSVPTWGEQYLQRQVDPFFLQPLVCPIPTAEHLSDFAANPQPPRESDDSRRKADDDYFVIDHRFVQPARFPLPAFGFNGECVEEPGAIVYEGMRLAIRPDGRYQVRFTVGTPAMPVTMQLQFELVDECTGTPYTLTLPPIAIPPEAQPTTTTIGNPVQPVAANVQTIHHEGYFAALDTCFVSKHLQVMRRTGTARFGFGINVP